MKNQTNKLSKKNTQNRRSARLRIDNYKKHRDFIKGFCCLNKQQKSQVQKNLDTSQINFINSVVFCLLKHILKIDDKSRKKLKRHKNNLKFLADENNNFKAKRKILIKGGFLGTVLSILASSIVPTVLEYIIKKVGK